MALLISVKQQQQTLQKPTKETKTQTSRYTTTTTHMCKHITSQPQIYEI